MIARELGLEPDRVERVRLAGILHDIGKIGVSDAVLYEARPACRRRVAARSSTHPEIAARLLARRSSTTCAPGCSRTTSGRTASGYPSGLAGDAIPLEARILAVADAYEAMTAERVYRPALGGGPRPRGARAPAPARSSTHAVVDALLRALDAEPPRSKSTSGRA